MSWGHQFLTEVKNFFSIFRLCLSKFWKSACVWFLYDVFQFNVDGGGGGGKGVKLFLGIGVGDIVGDL